LKIGTKVPYATGSFQPTTSGGGVNTQFQYFDVGLNMDITAKVHEPDEVSLHIESDASSVNGSVSLGNGVSQPVIAQRKRVADVRVKEGEINFWDIVTQRQEVRSSSGVPGLSQVPGMGRFFRTDQTVKTENQVVTLLTPHIIRAPDIRSVNLLSVPSGSDQVVRMRYRGTEQPAPPKDPNSPARTIELAPGTAPVTNTPVAVPPPGGAAAPPAGAPASPFGGGTPASPSGGAPASPFGGGAPAAPVGGTAKASFRPDEVEVAAGANFDVQLILADVAPLNEAMVTVSFDAATLKFVSAAAGGLAAGAEPAPGHRPTEGVLVLKNNGPVTGSGSLFKLTFQALKPGDSSVAIASFKATGAQAQNLPVEVEGLDVTIE
jgi:general secretion pathway protein D